MAFCKNCGTQLGENDTFCPVCGTRVDDAPAGEKKAGEESNFFKKLWNTLYNGPDHTSEYDPAELEADKAMGILSYLAILVLIPIFAAKENKAVRFHANQGLILLICGAICSVISWIPIIGWLVGYVGELACVLYAVIGIMHVCRGEEKELFYIGKFRILK